MAVFSKQAYILTAQTLEAQLPKEPDKGMNGVTHTTISIVINALASMFEEDNPRFDRQRFLKAAGVIPMEEA